MPEPWKPGDRVIVSLPDKSTSYGRAVDIHGTVRAVDDGGVLVDLDREINGVRGCYATHGELRLEVPR
jgi:hypothetical protein